MLALLQFKEHFAQLFGRQAFPKTQLCSWNLIRDLKLRHFISRTWKDSKRFCLVRSLVQAPNSSGWPESFLFPLASKQNVVVCWCSKASQHHAALLITMSLTLSALADFELDSVLPPSSISLSWPLKSLLIHTPLPAGWAGVVTVQVVSDIYASSLRGVARKNSVHREFENILSRAVLWRHLLNKTAVEKAFHLSSAMFSSA